MAYKYFNGEKTISDIEISQYFTQLQKEYLESGKEDVLVLSRHSGVFYFSQGIPIPSVWDFPSSSETLFLNQIAIQEQMFAECKVKNIVVVDRWPMVWKNHPSLLKQLTQHYHGKKIGRIGTWYKANCDNL